MPAIHIAPPLASIEDPVLRGPSLSTLRPYINLFAFDAISNSSSPSLTLPVFSTAFGVRFAVFILIAKIMLLCLVCLVFFCFPLPPSSSAESITRRTEKPAEGSSGRSTALLLLLETENG
ncbi:unnamed protein product [Calypogeia fissa]